MDHLTLSDISNITGLHKSSVLRRPEINSYIFGKLHTNAGRPVTCFRNDVLELFKDYTRSAQPKASFRKTRSDLGRSRKAPKQMEDDYINLVLQEYLSQASRRDVLNCCRRAAKSIWNSSWANLFASPEHLATHYYKNVIMRKTNLNINDSNLGCYYRHNWLDKWEARWKKKDRSLSCATMRYNILELGESLGLIGKGFGAASIFWLDDHTGDSFLRDQSRSQFQGSLPKGLFMIDPWTGMFLDYQPGEVNSIMVALMIVRASLRFGLPYIIGLENSRAMKSVRIDNIIEALYPDELLNQYKRQDFEWMSLLFDSHSPIVRNIPNIPRFLFKARLESLFKNIKSHDALRFPLSYQGGGLDPVQLHLNSTPLTPPHCYNSYIYEQSIRDYLSQDYLDKIRSSMFPSFQKNTGLLPNIRNVWDYYGGNSNPGTGIKPDSHKVAMLLFWLSDSDEYNDNSPFRKTIVKAFNGRVSCIINQQPCWFIAPELNGLKGERIAIVTIPRSLGDAMQLRSVAGVDYSYAALFHLYGSNVKFLTIAKNAYTADYREIQSNRLIVRATREHYKQLTNSSIPNITQSADKFAETLSINPEPQISAQISDNSINQLSQENSRLSSIQNEINNLLEI